MRWTWWNMWTLHTAFNRSYLWYLGTNKCDPFTPKMEKKGGCAALSSSGWDFWGLPVCSRGKNIHDPPRGSELALQLMHWVTFPFSFCFFSFFLVPSFFFFVFFFPFHFLFYSLLAFPFPFFYLHFHLAFTSFLLLPSSSKFKAKRGLNITSQECPRGILPNKEELTPFFAAQHCWICITQVIFISHFINSVL